MRDTLARMFRPRSIAVIGATDKGAAGDVLSNLRRSGYAGAVYPVNPSRASVDGQRCWPSVATVEDPIDMAAIVLRAERVPGAIDDCATKGIKAAIVFADGFAESGAAGAALQAEMVARAQRAGITLLGPNCIGFAAPAYGTSAYLDYMARMPRSGRIGIITQSGSVGVAALNHTGTLAVSAMISIGNEAMLGAGDVLRWLLADGITRAVALFLEGFRDGPDLLAACEEAAAQGVPVVLCKTGRSAAAAGAARSHTGALASNQKVVHAAFEARGVAVVEDLDELFAAAELLATGRPIGSRLAGVTLSGGHLALLHDLADAGGVAFPEPEPAHGELIVAALGMPRGTRNPVDCWVAGDVVGGVGRALGALAEGTAYDGFVVAVDTPADPPTSYVDMGRGIVAAAVALAEHDPRPVVFATTAIAADDPAVIDQLHAAGLPRLLGLASGFKAWGAIVRAQERHRYWTTAPESLPPQLDDLLPDTEPGAYAALVRCGIAVPRHRRCGNYDEALAAAAAIGYPVVAKLVSRRILHKTEVGGVCIGLVDEVAVAAAVNTLLSIPEAEAVLIAEMVEPGIDVLIGARIDPQLGPMVILGLGGIWAELLDDAILLPAPLLPAAVEAALVGTRLDRLLSGFRNQPPVNRGALCATAARLGDLVAALSLPDLAIDLNPVRVLRNRAIVLDAKFVPPAAAQRT